MDLLNLLKALDANTVAYVFIAFILLIWLAATYVVARNYHPRFQMFAPNLLTTLGILGTFVGISIGLANFDVTNIDDSIPVLLDGLKTAFITSIFGMFFSILTRGQSTWVRNGDDSAVGQVSPEHIHTALLDINRSVADGNATSERVRNAIAGDGDSSLVTQLQLMRSEARDNLSAIKQSLGTGADETSLSRQMINLRIDLGVLGESVATEFRNFAIQISELGSKQLVQALEEVIRDFNNKLTEQFGENFKRLDESVKKLVDWQSEYKDQVQQMSEQFKLSLKALLHSEEALKKIEKHTASIPENMEALSEMLYAQKTQIDFLEAQLAAFADLRDKAVEAFPEIDKRIDEVMDAMRAAVKKAADHYEIMLSDSDSLIRKFNESGSSLHEKFVSNVSGAVDRTQAALVKSATALEKGSDEFERNVTTASQNLETGITEASSRLENLSKTAFNEQNQRIQQLVTGLREAVSQAVRDQNELLGKQIRSLDDSMQKEMQRAMQILANDLAGVTTKFAQDYTQLTEKMKRVVDESRRLS